jgi:hypothetical protein
LLTFCFQDGSDEKMLFHDDVDADFSIVQLYYRVHDAVADAGSRRAVAGEVHNTDTVAGSANVAAGGVHNVVAGAGSARAAAGVVHGAVADSAVAATRRVNDAVAVLQALHVLLLEECMMLLQRQGEKFLLKFHSSASSQAPQGLTESKRHFHSPIIKVR